MKTVHKKKNFRNKRRMAGFNTIDLSGSIWIVAAVLGAILGAYKMLQETNNTSAVSNGLNIALSKSRARMSNFDSKFTNFTTSTCYSSNIFPSDWKSSEENQFNTPMGDNSLTCGSVDQATNAAGITTTGTGKFLYFEVNQVDQQQCNELVSQEMSNFIQINVNGTRIDSNPTLEAQCSSEGSDNVIRFIGR